MKKLTFEIEINAQADKVWNAMWEEENYKKWTSAFCEGSTTKSDWKQGERIHFLDPNGNGMYSEITTLIPNEKMFFTHIGNLKNFTEQSLDDESKTWSGAIENYSLNEENGKTKISVVIDVLEKYIEYYNTTFGLGLAIIREIAEN